jgi:hypothetical protein
MPRCNSPFINDEKSILLGKVKHAVHPILRCYAISLSLAFGNSSGLPARREFGQKKFLSISKLQVIFAGEEKEFVPNSRACTSRNLQYS